MHTLDPLLKAFVEAADEAEALRHQEDLICRHAAPVIQGVIGRKLEVDVRRRGSGDQRELEQDTADVYGEAVQRTIARLNELRADPAGNPIASLLDYVAVITPHVCIDPLAQFLLQSPYAKCIMNTIRLQR